MKKLIILAVVALSCSCHKTKTPAPAPTLTGHYVYAPDSKETLTFTGDSLTLSAPGIPVLTIGYTSLSNDTILLSNGVKIVAIPSKDSLLYIQVPFNDTSRYYRQ